MLRALRQIAEVTTRRRMVIIFSDLLTDLDSQYPGFRGRLVTQEGGLHRFVNVYVNDEDVRFLGGLEAPLSDGDQVVVLPAVAGG